MQALGVGFIVGGLVDVLALSGLNQVTGREEQRRGRINSLFRDMLDSADGYKDREAYRETLKQFVLGTGARLQDLDQDVIKALSDYKVLDAVVPGEILREIDERLRQADLPPGLDWTA